MKQVFGVTSASMLNVKTVLQEKYGDNIAVLPNNINQTNKNKYMKLFKSTKVVLVDSLGLLYSYVDFLNNLKTVVVVFDSPALLAKDRRIKILDSQTHSDPLHYKFVPVTIKYSLIYKAVAKQRRLKLRRKKFNILHEIIQNKLQNSVFDKLSTLLYAISVAQDREPKRQLLMHYVSGNMSLDKFKEEIRPQIKSKAKLTLLNSLIDFVESPKGKALQAALKLTRQGVSYKDAAAKYNVSTFDLQNIIIKETIK